MSHRFVMRVLTCACLATGMLGAAAANAADAAAKDRYEAGYASYLEGLDAQRNLFAVQQEVLRLRQSQLENAVALYQALGGGWQLADTAAPQP